jgi:NADH-quinone oxidoreductase subunit N
MVIDLGSAGGLLVALLPEFLLTMWGCIIMLVAGWRHRDASDQRFAGQLSIAAFLTALIAVLWMWVMDARANAGAHIVALDAFRYASSAVFLLGALLASFLSLGYVGRERILAPEYYVLLVFSTVGMMMMAAAADLLLVFLALEVMSVSVYVLVGINRRSVHGAEGALKYFLLGAFASGFLLYGVALIYGATGTTNLSLIDYRTASLGVSPMLLAGVALLLVGFGFKVAAVPFHMWTPDVYDGAPTPITAFMAAAVKAAGFAALVRILIHALGDSAAVWQQALWWLAVLTMVGGNLMALAQRGIKRMLAYSSIGHAGYLLTATASGTETGAGAFLFYALAYTLMTIGAFAVVGVVGRNGERDLQIDDFAGMANRRPWLALAMAIFMLSLLGFPGTAGFIAKWFVLSASIEAGQWSLAIVLVVASVFSAGYYLPVIMEMYMRPPRVETSHEQSVATGATRWVVAATAVALLVFGFWPQPALNVARDASQDLRPAVEFTTVGSE